MGHWQLQLAARSASSGAMTSNDPRQNRLAVPEEDAATMQLGEDFADARPLWNAEVNLILKHHIDGLKKEEGKAEQHTVPPMIEQTLIYVKGLNNFLRQEAIEEAQALLAKYPSVSRWELALLNNLRIDDYEECITLVPTLRQKIEAYENNANVPATQKMDRESLNQLLAELKKYQNS